MQLDDVTEGIVCHVSQMTRGLFTVPEAGAALSGDEARSHWRRMKQLPFAEQMRCHVPRYGISLGRDGEYRWFATICWQCNNISICCDGEEAWQIFDGQSQEAQQLLSEIRALLGDAADTEA